MVETRTNWAGNYTYHAQRLHRPGSIEELQALVRGVDKLKVLGTRHSFNEIADSSEDQVSLEHFDRVVALDRDHSTVTIEGGVRYGPLAQYLHREGYALGNMASLPHISVAGACATGTHGSGDTNRVLADGVAAVEIVTADGEIVNFRRDGNGAEFRGVVVGLGGLGVVTKLTLDVVPSFEMRQDVYENLPLEQLEAHFDEIVGGDYSVSLLTDWQTPQIAQVWRKAQVSGTVLERHPVWFGAQAATVQRHPLANMPAENCTEQLGVQGPWHERLPHFKLAFTPSAGEELQSEYILPREHAAAAFRRMVDLGPRLAPVLQISEVRTVAADDLWMSPCYNQASVAIHFTWIKDWDRVKAVLPAIEAQLTPFKARPHWGKLFTLPGAQVQQLYPRLRDFQALLRAYDPRGKFRNAFLDTYIFSGA